jgi:peptide/nickel transport system ATP-binding protein
MTQTVPTLSVEHLSTAFQTRRGKVIVVDDVSFHVNQGEILGLVGESGSGKSVTGYSILGLIEAPGSIESGRVLFQGDDLLKLTPKAQRRLRGSRIAMIFQDPMATLNPVLRVDVQMIEAVRAHIKVSKLEARERASRALGMMGIPSPEERLRSYPHQMSGGMRQRVAIAIAMLHEPDLIIADEPTTALDVTIQAQILSEIQQLAKHTGTSLIWISHDLSVVAGLADTVAVMYAGRIVENGRVDDILDRPQHPYTQGLIGSIPSANERGQRLRQIPGTTPASVNLPVGCAFAPRCPRAQAKCEELPELLPVSDARGAEHLVRCFFPGPPRPAEGEP